MNDFRCCLSNKLLNRSHRLLSPGMGLLYCIMYINVLYGVQCIIQCTVLCCIHFNVSSVSRWMATAMEDKAGIDTAFYRRLLMALMLTMISSHSIITNVIVLCLDVLIRPVQFKMFRNKFFFICWR